MKKNPQNSPWGYTNPNFSRDSKSKRRFIIIKSYLFLGFGRRCLLPLLLLRPELFVSLLLLLLLLLLVVVVEVVVVMVVVVKVGLEPLGAAAVQDLEKFKFEF